jgi:phosphoribosylformimino-5-aminoimidazole carboxamide ribotide isomerase
MIAIPAVDLREGACVQLVGGAYDDERIRLDDPLEVARGWRTDGFGMLHVVDLDAATGRGSNAAIVRMLAAEPSLAVQVGGGIRTLEAIDRVLRDGAARVVVGTRAIEDPEWLHAAADRFPGTIVVAADVRGEHVVTRGWARDSTLSVFDVVDAVSTLPLAAILVTAVHREGRLEGPDLALLERVAARAAVPVQASGGITTAGDLRALERCGIAAAIIGMALYTGALDGRATAEEFDT